MVSNSLVAMHGVKQPGSHGVKQPGSHGVKQPGSHGVKQPGSRGDMDFASFGWPGHPIPLPWVQALEPASTTYGGT